MTKPSLDNVQSARSPVASIMKETGLDSLGENPKPDVIEAALRKLSGSLQGADDLRIEMVYEAAIAALIKAKISAPKRVLRLAMVKFSQERRAEASDDLQGRAITWSDPKPPSGPVDGADLILDLVGTIMGYLVLPEGAAETMALWLLHAHAHPASEVSPRLVLRSPEKRCGKTTTLTLIGALAPRIMSASNITTAALFRSVERYYPTLLVDEADTFIHESEELRGVLNSGHLKSGTVIRCVGEDFEPRQFGTFCPIAIAVIGNLPTTLEDRSIVIAMRRKAPGEKVRALRLDRLASLDPLRAKCAKWAADNLESLRNADPVVPESLNDRAKDNWRPLLAIAERIGGEWPRRAREAALALSGESADSNDSIRVMLLRDIRDAFRPTEERLASEELVARLTSREDRPWGEWGRDNPKPISTVQLARLLKPFGIRPTQARDGVDRIRGYARAAFQDAWSRYAATVQLVTPETPLETKDLESGVSRDKSGLVTTPEAGVTSQEERDVPVVTPQLPDQERRQISLDDMIDSGSVDPSWGRSL